MKPYERSITEHQAFLLQEVKDAAGARQRAEQWLSKAILAASAGGLGPTAIGRSAGMGAEAIRLRVRKG